MQDKTIENLPCNDDRSAISTFFRSRTATPLPIIDRAEGIYMWDSLGNKYIDGTSGPVLANLGHGNRRVLAAMRAQAERVCFAFPTSFDNSPNMELADIVAANAGMGLERVYFTSGGSEATECALKLARQYAMLRGESGRTKVISRLPSYHGGTLGALAVTGDPLAHKLFGDMMVNHPKVPLPFSYRVPDGHTRESYSTACAAALEEEIIAQGEETILAFVMEPVGGVSSGANVATDDYYVRVRDICTKYGIMLIFDEVMSGAGRTGEFLAAHHWKMARPDIVTMAKGLTAGYAPMGAVLCSKQMAQTVADSGGIATVFSYIANPLSCAIGLAVVRETVESGLVEAADRIGERLRQGLKSLQQRSAIIGDVRGKGMLLAIELVADKQTKSMLPAGLESSSRIAELARQRGLIQYVRRTAEGAFGEWMMITPPLITTADEADEILNRLGDSIEAYEQELRQAGLIGTA